jgi:hypothetical protein
LKAKGGQLAGAGEQHVAGEADLGGGDRQHAVFAGGLGAETGDHMVDVVGGGDPLGEPTAFAAHIAWAEELRVVAQREDQIGVAAPEGAGRQLAQGVDVGLQGWVARFQHRRPARHGPETLHAGGQLGAALEAVDQVGHAGQLTAAAADGGQQAQVVGGAEQLLEAGHRDGEGWLQSAAALGRGSRMGRFECPARGATARVCRDDHPGAERC